MRRCLLIVIVQLACACNTSAQGVAFDKVWVNGGGRYFTSTFNGGEPVNEIHGGYRPIFLGFGHSNICDSSGRLLLCGAEYDLYDADLKLIEGGGRLIDSTWYEFTQGYSATSQTSIILPASATKYYYINCGVSDSLKRGIDSMDQYGISYVYEGIDRLYYNVVDMAANAGKGKVTRRMVPLANEGNLTAVRMTACRHGNGKDWWLVKHAYDVNMVYKYLFTADSVYGPFIQTWTEPKFGPYDFAGQSAFTRDGKHYATTSRGAGLVYTLDFDRCTGMFSNPKTYAVSPQLYEHPTFPGVENFTEALCYSPNGRFIYVATYYNILQLDLQEEDTNARWTRIAGMDTTWKAFQKYGPMYLGPDDRLYIGNWHGLSGQMSRIDYPNEKGTACSFCPRCMRFPPFLDNGNMISIAVSSPPNMPNYHLGPLNPDCNGVFRPDPIVFRFFPNPARGAITIEYSGPGGTLVLTDALGRLVRKEALLADASPRTIDVSGLAAGLYLYKYVAQGGTENSGKVAVY